MSDGGPQRLCQKKKKTLVIHHPHSAYIYLKVSKGVACRYPARLPGCSVSSTVIDDRGEKKPSWMENSHLDDLYFNLYFTEMLAVTVVHRVIIFKSKPFFFFCISVSLLTMGKKLWICSMDRLRWQRQTNKSVCSVPE